MTECHRITGLLFHPAPDQTICACQTDKGEYIRLMNDTEIFILGQEAMLSGDQYSKQLQLLRWFAKAHEVRVDIEIAAHRYGRITRAEFTEAV